MDSSPERTRLGLCVGMPLFLACGILSCAAVHGGYTRAELMAYLTKLGGEEKILSGQNAKELSVPTLAETVLGEVHRRTGRWMSVYGMDLAIYMRWCAGTDTMIHRVEEQYNAGGIITMTLHMENPETGENFSSSLSDQRMLIDPELKPEVYKAYWALMDSYARELKKTREKGIPILIRPYHEMTGSWFWWGLKKGADPELFAEFYRRLWRKTHDLFTKVHGLDNLVWVYSIAHVNEEAALLGWPGDAYVDMTGVDAYGNLADPDYRAHLKVGWDLLRTTHKPIAFSECGPGWKLEPRTDYDYVAGFLGPVKEHFPEAVYFLAWDPPLAPIACRNAQALYDDPWTVNRGELSIGAVTAAVPAARHATPSP